MNKNLLVMALTFSTMAGAQIEKIANCQDKDSDMQVQVIKQPWDRNTHQYVVHWNLNGREFAHQFIGKDIRKDKDTEIVLKEKNSILGVFCREKYLLKLNKVTGKATFRVKDPACGGIVIGDGPHFPGVPMNFKKKLQCEL